MAIHGLMRPLAAVATIFVCFAGQAAADSIDDRPQLSLQIEGRSPTAEASGRVDAPTDAPKPDPAPAGAAAPRAGNPLWAISLDSLSETRDRPLFSVSRRPPVVTPVLAAVEKKQEIVPPPPPERPSLTLVGTIVSRKGSVAMVQGASGGEAMRIRVGQENDGWQVQGIGLRSIVVGKGEQSVELALPKRDAGPAE